MNKLILLTSSLILLVFSSYAQVINQYHQSTPPAVYTPMSTDELIKIAQLRQANAQSRNEAQARAKASFNRYQDAAFKALTEKKYHDAIKYCNQALATTFYNSDIYLMRAAAYVQLDLIRDARKDLKIAAKLGSSEAKVALKQLKK